MTRCKPCFNRTCSERWQRVKREEIERMGGCCADGKGIFHPDVYDVHHLDPRAKEYVWQKLKMFSADRRRRELGTCMLLCANCHRLRHALQRSQDAALPS